MSELKSALEGVQDQVADAIAAQQERAANEAIAAEAEAEQAARRGWLATLVEGAWVVAVADGSLSDTECEAMCQGIASLSEDIGTDEVHAVLEEISSCDDDQDTRIARVAETVADDFKDAAFIVAAAVAWKDGGIGAKQGGAVRALGNALGYSESQYQALLAKGRG